MNPKTKPRQVKPKADKLSGQQEKFAREYVRLGSGAAAYRLAYNVREGTKPSSIHVNASQLLSEPKIAQRVEALTAQAAEKAVVTRSSILVEMGQNRALAIQAEQFGVAQSASRDRAKVAGILVDKLEHTGKDGAAIVVDEQVTLEERSANDLARRVAALLRKGQREAAKKGTA